MSGDLAGLLVEVDAILLDFDGPVCSIFAGYPAHDVAAELVELLRHHDVDLPPGLAGEADPLEVLRWTGSTGNYDVTRAVEEALCTAERRAVGTAAPTPYGRETIVAARQAGLPVAVVSNNSAGAVTAYLTLHRLEGHVAHVIGRAFAEPARMKPNPEPILHAVRALEVSPSRCVLVGDSMSDIEGARAAGTQVLAFANRPEKVDRFSKAEPDALITSMGSIAEELIRRCEEPDEESLGRIG
ncbi:HAD-IA family hydrolase [Actinoplanes sp. NPDC051470]|uniref:HAD family hydrolase n=1 Tax=Actinoplanes sp. NPDC051470 TaxID=3157224 RepID=UPI00341C790D